jgi:hypothetical protein
MDIVFIAPTGMKKIPQEYEEIIRVCKQLRTKVNADYIKETPHNVKDMEKKYWKTVDTIKHTDIVIAEATQLTVDISRLISISLQNHVPTILLYKEKSPASFVFEPSRLLLMKHYSLDTLEEILRQHLKKVSKKKLLYRFNLMLSKELGSYVMDKSKKQRVSKADYIRKLITDDMEKTT